MKFPITEIPFTRYGSYFVLSQGKEDGKVYIRDLHGGDGAPSYLFAFSVPEHVTVSATETQATICGDDGECAVFVMGAGGTMHIKLSGLSLKLEQHGSRYDSIVPYSDSRWEAFFYKKNRKLMISCLEGRCQKFGEWVRVGEKDGGIVLNSDGGEAHVVIDNYQGTWQPATYDAFERIAEDAQAEFAAWRKTWKLPPISGDAIEPADLAVYLLWANFVKAEGALPYDALYCSNNWMNNIWSWDNCFMAIALSPYFPTLAYQQLQTFFHVQDASGCYPDYVNDVFASYSCCKPPIHAWAFREMRSLSADLQSQENLDEAYQSFKKVTDYWLNYRVFEGQALPAYNHGNDSGWDNSSIFHDGVPVISPDLSAHIIRQLDILAGFAQELGKPEEAAQLRKKADRLFESLMTQCFDGKRFFAVHVPTGQRICEGDSLLAYIPIVIGYRLPKETLDFIVNEMLEKFEAPYGLCTENPKSKNYKNGGYWLGPIWAPTTYLVIDALAENGYVSDAHRLAQKFLALPKIGMMAENFDAFSGEGFDDPAFSWTSAVYMHLLGKYGT